MHNSTAEINPTSQSKSPAKILFVLFTFFVPLGGALFLFNLGLARGAKIDGVDFVFCMTTLSNCQAISPFYDIAGWDNLAIKNSIMFSVWLVYAVAVYILLNVAGIFWKLCSSALIVMIPLGLSVFSLLLTLLEGAHL